MNIDFLREVSIWAVPTVFAIIAHEVMHGTVARWLGDDTAARAGRLTLNPISHIDPFGTIIMPLILIVLGFPPFGWAKPTPVDPRNFKNQVSDDILTAVAGPVSNFVTAFVAVVILAIILHGSSIVAGNHMRTATTAEALSVLFYDAMWINVILAVFNLIPLPPLDGSHVIRHFLSYDTLKVYDRFGYGALIVVLFILPMIGFNLVGILVSPFLTFFQALLAVFLGFR